MKTYYIYQLSSRYDNRVYIGCTTNLKRRFVDHLRIDSLEGGSCKIKELVKLYGKEDWVIEALFQTEDKELAYQKEIDYQINAGGVWPNTLNLQLGSGKNSKCKETLKLHSKSGKIVGKQNAELKRGFCGRSKEQLSLYGKKGGKIVGKQNAELKRGFCGRSKEQHSLDGKLSAHIRWHVKRNITNVNCGYCK